MGRIRVVVMASLACLLTLVVTVGSSAAAPPVAIGTAGNDLAGLAVDASGTAYIAWEDASGPFLHYCKLPAHATACSVSYSSAGQPGGLNAPQEPAGAGVLGTPSVVLVGHDIMVFAFDNGAGSYEGVAGWVSSDGGNTFAFEPPGSTMSYTPPFNDSTTTNPVSELGDGLVGVGYVVPQGSPQFQAVRYDPSTDSFQAISQSSYLRPPGPPYAKLDPTNRYAAGNLGGEFAAQPVGSANAGVMGAITAFPNAAQNPCSDGYPFVSWAFAPLGAATTQAALNTDPGAAGSAWTQSLTPLQCNSENPAVAGGPGGFGILSGAYIGHQTVYHRFNEADGRFDLPAVMLAPEAETSPALSQDAGGGVYASWITGGSQLRLAYSPDGGSSWNGPVTLTGATVGNAASTVNSSGSGLAAYDTGGTEYAQPFSKADAIVPPQAGRTGVSNGRTVSLSVSCQTTPCTVTVTITATQIIVSRRARDARRRLRTIRVARGTFRLRKKGANKVAVRLTGAGRTLITKNHGHLGARIVVGVRVAGVTVNGRAHGFNIKTVHKTHKR